MKALLIALLTAGLTTQAFAGEPAAQPVRVDAPAVASVGLNASSSPQTPTITTPTKAAKLSSGSMTTLYVVGGVAAGAIIIGASSSSGGGNSNATGAGGTTGTTGT